ncbi:hypothetical protein N0V93_003473 [Gnomoniopsis smithogilvyi]|uniref:Extracellular membrane protein CFEM domain-containing protein n=1 Tax=Gnomoniopsis smithogilvyi TaxID=1191159 RepID=A0A9W9CZ65_9PEZI|nr:hypothetical protein N0V93_003473 [Gnomoniopsis smithogilvyi]
MLLTALCHAVFVVSLLPTRVLGNDGDDDDDSVTFEFTDCALACIDAAGFDTGSEDEQKTLCVASRDGLLEVVEACMLSTCSDGLAYVDQDLLTPMQTGCKELEKPVSDQEIEEAEAAAVVILATASILVQAPSTSAQSILEAETSTQIAPTPVAQSTLSTEMTTVVAISTVSSLTQSPDLTTTAVLPSEPAPTSVEQSTPSAKLTTEVAISTQLTPTTMSSTVQSSSTSSIVSQTATSLAQAAVQPSVGQDANGQFQATGTPATTWAVTSTVSAEGRTTKSTTSSTEVPKKHGASTTTSSSSLSGDHMSASSSMTASSTGDDSLEMETATPTAYTGTIFTFVTSIAANTGSIYSSPTSSSGSSSSTSTSENGIGGGSPFSTSAAASKQHTCGLAALFAAMGAISLMV